MRRYLRSSRFTKGEPDALAFLFPQQSIPVMYFDGTTGQSFADIDPRIADGAQNSSGSEQVEFNSGLPKAAN